MSDTSNEHIQTRESSKSVRLSVLNPELQKKLKKLDTGNEGEITLQDALHGLVTLQKQSDNYKKMIWLLIPVLLGLIACTFGTTMLAFKLNQQTQISSTGSLQDMNGNVIKVATTQNTPNLRSIMLSEDIYKLDKIYNLYTSSYIDTIYVNRDQDDKIISSWIITPSIKIYATIEEQHLDYHSRVNKTDVEYSFVQNMLTQISHSKLMTKSFKCHNGQPSFMCFGANDNTFDSGSIQQ